MKLIAIAAAVIVVSITPATQRLTVTSLATIDSLVVDEPVGTADGRRVYFTTDKDVRMIDKATRKVSVIYTGEAYYMALSPSGDVLAFTRRSEGDRKAFIWRLPLDSATGMPSGDARRVTTREGDTPSISPDGKWLAYAGFDSVGQRVAVVPIEGGPERVVVHQPACGIEPIRWSPDAQYIYFGCDWWDSTEVMSIKRVPASGGRAEVVVKDLDWPYPGLSPDGQMILTEKNDSTYDLYRVSGLTVSAAGTLPRDPATDSYAWLGNSQITAIKTLIPSSMRRIEVVSMNDGRRRAVTGSDGSFSAPMWNRDGSQFATIMGEALVFFDANGSGRREYPVNRPVRGVIWSNDSKWIAYTSGVEVHAMDAATGRDVRLFASERQLPLQSMIWSSDSRSVLFAVNADTSNTGGIRFGVAVHQTTLSGVDRVLRTIRANCSPCVFPVNDTTAIGRNMSTTGAVSLYKLVPNGATTAVTSPQTGFTSLPTISTDGRWVAIRERPTLANAPFRRLTLIPTGAGATVQLDIPADIVSGEGNPTFLAGSSEMLVMTSSGSTDSATVYRANPDTKSVTRVRAVPTRGMPGSYAFSPDGRSLVLLTPVPRRNTVQTIAVPRPAGR